MKFSLEFMLFGLATILRRNAKQPAVQAMLRDRHRIVQMRTQDGDVGRCFAFSGGAVFSRRGVVPNPDVSFVWKDADVAARTLRSADPDAMPKALADDRLRIVGDGEVASWFGELVRLARGRTQQAAVAKPPVAVIGLGRMGSGIAAQPSQGRLPADGL